MVVRIRLEEISIWLTLVERSKRKFVIEIDYIVACAVTKPHERGSSSLSSLLQVTVVTMWNNTMGQRQTRVCDARCSNVTKEEVFQIYDYETHIYIAPLIQIRTNYSACFP